jgi:hypothetical protein
MEASDSEQRLTHTPVDVRAPGGRFWLWFVAGFALVFIVLLFAITTLYMHPSGDALVAAPLWQYYAVQIPRALGPPKVLGPAMVDRSEVISTLFWHLVWSAGGGLVAVAIGWTRHRLRSRRPPAPTP